MPSNQSNSTIVNSSSIDPHLGTTLENFEVPVKNTPKGIFAVSESLVSMKAVDLSALEKDPKGLFAHLFSKNNPSANANVTSTGLEDNPKGFFANWYSNLKAYLFGAEVPVELPVAPVAPAKPNTRTWIDEEIANLRALIESDGINMDNFVQKLAELTRLSFFKSSQIESDEIKALYEGLKKMLQDQREFYNSKKVLYTDVANAAFAILGGGAGLASPHIATATQTMSQAGQSASKIFGNSVERDKAQVQHLIEHLKQMIEQTRAHRTAMEQQTGKMDDHRTGVNQMRGQIVGQINSN